jgi:GxxExxY protein
VANTLAVQTPQGRLEEISRKGAKTQRDKEERRRRKMDENDVARVVVDAAFKIHTTLGPGLLESVYLAVMEYELKKRGLYVQREVGIPVVYEDVHLELGFRADLIVEGLLVAELKSVAELHPVHKKQLLTYLRLTNKRLGLLINFNVPLIKTGISRVANGMPS